MTIKPHSLYRDTHHPTLKSTHTLPTKTSYLNSSMYHNYQTYKYQTFNPT
eukprot:gene3173-2155_t